MTQRHRESGLQAIFGTLLGVPAHRGRTKMLQSVSDLAEAQKTSPARHPPFEVRFFRRGRYAQLSALKRLAFAGGNNPHKCSRSPCDQELGRTLRRRHDT